jgi:hypothetical protein
VDAEDFWAMGKQQKKIDARLTRRLNGHFRAVKEMEQKRAGSSKGYRAPGSRNPRKC